MDIANQRTAPASPHLPQDRSEQLTLQMATAGLSAGEALDRLTSIECSGRYARTACSARYMLDGNTHNIDVVIAAVRRHIAPLETAEAEYRAHMEIPECAECMGDLDALRVVLAALEGVRRG